MKLEFAKESQFPGRGPCIVMDGYWVTERVHDAVYHVLNDTYMESPFYKARQGFSVFFQGGYDDPRGKFIMLEFWVKDLSQTDEFVRLLEKEINKVIVSQYEKLMVSPYNMNYNDGKGSYDAISMIEKEVGCRVDWGDSMTPITFYPETNVQYDQVRSLCDLFGLKVTKFRDTWEA